MGLECNVSIGMVMVGNHNIFLFLLGQVLMSMLFIELHLLSFVNSDISKMVSIDMADFFSITFLVIILSRLLARVHYHEVLIIGVKYLCKAEVLGVPIVGIIIMICLQCLLVVWLVDVKWLEVSNGFIGMVSKIHLATN